MKKLLKLVLWSGVVIVGVFVCMMVFYVSTTTPEEREATAAKQRQEAEERAKAKAETKAKADLETAKREREERETAIENAIPAANLVALYEQNEVKADSLLKGKTVAIAGVIDGIGKDILDTPYVTLKGTANTFRSVQCMFTKKDLATLGELNPGQKVVIHGKVDGLMMNVLIRNSKLLN